MEYSLSHDDYRIKVEVDGKFTTFPYMPGLSMNHIIHSFLFQYYFFRLEDMKPIELSEIPEFPDRLVFDTPAEKRLESQD